MNVNVFACAEFLTACDVSSAGYIVSPEAAPGTVKVFVVVSLAVDDAQRVAAVAAMVRVLVFLLFFVHLLWQNSQVVGDIVIVNESQVVVVLVCHPIVIINHSVRVVPCVHFIDLI